MLVLACTVSPALTKLGMTIATRRPMMTTTTIISTSVKPAWKMVRVAFIWFYKYQKIRTGAMGGSTHAHHSSGLVSPACRADLPRRNDLFQSCCVRGPRTVPRGAAVSRRGGTSRSGFARPDCWNTPDAAELFNVLRLV